MLFSLEIMLIWQISGLPQLVGIPRRELPLQNTRRWPTVEGRPTILSLPRAFPELSGLFTLVFLSLLLPEHSSMESYYKRKEDRKVNFHERIKKSQEFISWEMVINSQDNSQWRRVRRPRDSMATAAVPRQCSPGSGKPACLSPKLSFIQPSIHWSDMNAHQLCFRHSATIWGHRHKLDSHRVSLGLGIRQLQSSTNLPTSLRSPFISSIFIIYWVMIF